MLKRTLFFVFTLITFMGYSQEREETEPVKVIVPAEKLEAVSNVDLQKFAGKWYQVAAYPSRFQKDCYCSQAEYTLTEKGYMKIVNSCRKGSPEGKLKIANGKAWAVKGSNNAKLKVQFAWPFKGDYWIIGLEKNYRAAIVSDSKRKYLWILSRTPKMENDAFQKVLEVVRAKGFDLTKIELDSQECK